MRKETMIKKLAAVKALAENGVGGEKETARRMYEDLKAKYNITDGEVAAVKEPAAADAGKEFSGTAFALWTTAQNLEEEQELCRNCSCSGSECFHCSTWENIKDLEKQYDDLCQI